MSNDFKSFEEKIYKVLKTQSKKYYVIYNNKLNDDNEIAQSQNMEDLNKLKTSPDFQKAQKYIKKHNKILKKNISKFSFSGNGFSIKSIYRGDILIKKNNKIIILDCKNYAKLHSKFQTSNDITDKTHMKTMEIHLRNLILGEYFTEIFNFNLESFIQGNFEYKYINKNDFINLIKTLEFGFINKVSNCIHNKFFISKKKNSLLISELNFKNISNKVKMRSKKYSDYYYIQFINDENDVLYEISMRNSSQGNFQANTSSIHKSLLKRQEVNNADDLVIFFDNYNIETNIKMPKKYYLNALNYIKLMENVESDEIAQYLYNYHKHIINQLNTTVSREKVIKRIKQDLNPKFKSICLKNQIHYCPKSKRYSIIY